MGDLQGLMVFICILSKHGSCTSPARQYIPPCRGCGSTIITFILAFFNFRISIKTVFPSGLHFSTNIQHFLPEIEDDHLPVAPAPAPPPPLTGLGRLFLLSRHSQSSSTSSLPEFSQDRIGSSESSLNSWGS